MVNTDYPKKSREAPGTAVCQDCPWVLDCTRERARVHVVEHRHTVRYSVTDITVYTPLGTVYTPLGTPDA